MKEPTKQEYLSQEGYDLMAAAFEVHAELNGGLSEEIYQDEVKRRWCNKASNGNSN